MGTATILVVCSDPSAREQLQQRCVEQGYRIVLASSTSEVIRGLAVAPDAAVVDGRYPGEELELVELIRSAVPDLPVILATTSSWSIEDEIRSVKAGTFHCFSKPVDQAELISTLAFALESSKLREDLSAQGGGEGPTFALGQIIGMSPAMRHVKQVVIKIARSAASTVLITGESGTGKDVTAKAIHFSSRRTTQPFVNITCSALPETLLESELFGHEKGAFTDARQQKRGLLEQANGGTVFLDEIGEMAPGLQAKLLRFLEEKAFRRVGGNVDIKVDVRVIAATHRDLEQAVTSKTFRQDLYYRLRVMPIEMPPLRARGGDVRLLTAHFVDRFNTEFGKRVARISPSALARLESHAWPGNVRELKNAVERAMLLSEDDALDLADFPFASPTPVGATFRLPPGGVNLRELERSLVAQALERTGGNQTRAAALLGLRRDQIRSRMEKFGLRARPGSDGAEDLVDSVAGTPGPR